MTLRLHILAGLALLAAGVRPALADDPPPATQPADASPAPRTEADGGIDAIEALRKLIVPADRLPSTCEFTPLRHPGRPDPPAWLKRNPQISADREFTEALARSVFGDAQKEGEIEAAMVAVWSHHVPRNELGLYAFRFRRPQQADAAARSLAQKHWPTESIRVVSAGCAVAMVWRDEQRSYLSSIFAGHVVASIAEVGAVAPPGLFGINDAGRDIVFVLDQSNSMFNDFPYVQAELSRALGDLGPRQRFHVIFFSGAGAPELKISDKAELRPPTPANLAAARKWVASQVPLSVTGITDPSRALARAMEIEPDTIFLLTDGQFPDNALEGVRRARTEAKVRIHTIAIRHETGEKQLKQIALDNGGAYRFISA